MHSRWLTSVVFAILAPSRLCGEVLYLGASVTASACGVFIAGRLTLIACASKSRYGLPSSVTEAILTWPGGSEIGFPVDSDAAVHSTRDAWANLGLKILQEPTKMDFGLTFTAADPDGHRLRVFNPSQG